MPKTFISKWLASDTSNCFTKLVISGSPGGLTAMEICTLNFSGGKKKRKER